MDRNKFIPTENQLHPVHLVCAEGLYQSGARLAVDRLKIRGIQPPLTRYGRDGSVLGTKPPLGVAPGWRVERIKLGMSTVARSSAI